MMMTSLLLLIVVMTVVRVLTVIITKNNNCNNKSIDKDNNDMVANISVRVYLSRGIACTCMCMVQILTTMIVMNSSDSVFPSHDSACRFICLILILMMLNVSSTVTDQSTIQRYFARFDEKFFQFCDKELAKINTFFLGR